MWITKGAALIRGNTVSNHHKLATTILRTTISKGNSEKMFYRDYKRFDQQKFETELKLKLNLQTNLSYSTFQAVFLELLNKIAPANVKVLRFNNNTFMTKYLRKAIMLTSRLKNNFNKKRSDENWDNYKKQRNFCVRLLRQTKEKYFSDTNAKSISDNKKFWKTIKPFFSNTGLNTNNMMLVENKKIVCEEEIIANIMNNYFTNITTHLKPKPTHQNWYHSEYRKYPSEHLLVFKTSWRRLLGNNFSSSKTSWRRLEDMSWRRLGDKQNVYWGCLYLTMAC